MVALVELARWRLVACSEAPASCRASAPCYRFPKDVGIVAVVMAELKLRQVKRQILLADMVERADHSTFEQAPEVFDIVGVHFAAHIFSRAVLHNSMLETLGTQIAVAAVLVGRHQVYFVAYRFTHETVQGPNVSVFDHLADHVTLAGDGADHRSLAAGDAALTALFVPVAVYVAAAKKRLIDFDDTHKLAEIRVLHRGAQPMAHVPGRLVRSGTDLPLNLEGAYALLGIEYLPENLKPNSQRIFGVLEDSSHGYRKSIGRIATNFADPIERLPVESADLFIPASRATNDTIRPAVIHEKLLAGRFIWKGVDQLFERHHE